jgi:hypothetical protein
MKKITKKYDSQWVPPEKRMRKYKKNIKDTSKIPFVDFTIVVPTEEDKKQFQAGCEFIHNCDEIMDNEFIIINQIAHSYVDETVDKGAKSNIVVDHDLYHELKQHTCPHPENQNYIRDGIKYCKLCWKALEITSFRGL